MGYKGAREMTEKKLIRNVKTVGDVYVNTGDLLKIDKDGHVYFIDRLGDTFRSDERLYFVGTIPLNISLGSFVPTKIPNCIIEEREPLSHCPPPTLYCANDLHCKKKNCCKNLQYFTGNPAAQ